MSYTVEKLVSTTFLKGTDEQLDKKAIELKNAMLFIFEEIKE